MFHCKAKAKPDKFRLAALLGFILYLNLSLSGGWLV
jgi:hypothetical protein